VSRGQSGGSPTVVNLSFLDRTALHLQRLFSTLYCIQKNAFFWDVTQHHSCENRCFGGPSHLRFQGEENQRARNGVSSNWQLLRSVLRLLVIANVPRSPILVTLMVEAISSYETPILTGTTRRHIPKYGILHSHRRKNITPYTVLHCLRHRLSNIAVSTTEIMLDAWYVTPCSSYTFVDD
jgi:hypothetical protein